MAEIVVIQNKTQPATAPRIRWQVPTAVVAATGLTALCAHITIPLGFTAIPVTMQTFAVLLIGLLLSPSAAFASLSLYLLEGAVGLPVFSPHGPGGMMQLIGPSGGYLLCYPFAASLASFFYRRARRTLAWGLLATASAGIFILVIGAAWLGILTHAKFSIVFAQSIAPFIPGDIAKMIAATLCAQTLASLRRPRHN